MPIIEIDGVESKQLSKAIEQAYQEFVIIDEATEVNVKRINKHSKKIVRMFMDPKFRWTANGLCPVWIVPETSKEVI